MNIQNYKMPELGNIIKFRFFCDVFEKLKIAKQNFLRTVQKLFTLSNSIKNILYED